MWLVIKSSQNTQRDQISQLFLSCRTVKLLLQWPKTFPSNPLSYKRWNFGWDICEGTKVRNYGEKWVWIPRKIKMLACLEYWDFYDSLRSMETSDDLIESFPVTSKKGSVWMLIEEITHHITEKEQFKIRIRIISKADFRFLKLSRV